MAYDLDRHTLSLVRHGKTPGVIEMPPGQWVNLYTCIADVLDKGMWFEMSTDRVQKILDRYAWMLDDPLAANRYRLIEIPIGPQFRIYFHGRNGRKPWKVGMKV
jgi:hypothetical protein